MFVFISYSRKDAARAKAFAEAFEADGVATFWDRAIPAGVRWDDYLERKLAEADIVLVLWSEASLASPYVKEEAEFGKRQGKLVPVAIDKVEPPFGFSLLHAVDFTTWDGATTSEAWAALRHAMARTREARAAGVGPDEASFTLVARDAPRSAPATDRVQGEDDMAKSKTTASGPPAQEEHAMDAMKMEAMAPAEAMMAMAPAPKPTGVDPSEPATDPVVGWLVVVKGPGRGRSRPLGLGVNPIGRAAGNRVTLDFGDTGISREEHMSVVFEPRARDFVAVPGRAQNLVRVNDEALLAPKSLADGDMILLGDTELRVVTLCGPGFAW
jgi:hypothetical protein